MTEPARQTADPVIAPFKLVLAVGVFGLVLAALVWVYIIYSPSDGVRMSKLPEAASSEGIYIDVLSENSLLKNSDLVIAVQGKPLSSWAEGLWRPASWSSPWKFGETIPFLVVRQGRQVEVPVLLAQQPVREILSKNWSVLLFAFIFQLIALFILILKPREPAAQALFLWGMTISHFYVWSSYHQIYDFITGYGFWLYIGVASFLWVSSWAAGLHLALTFPSPLPRLQARLLFVWLLYPISYAVYIFYLFLSRFMTANELEWVSYWNRGDTLIAILLFIPSIIALIHQYRLHRSGPERQKIQWVVFSALFSGSMAMIFYLVPEFLGLQGFGVNAVGILLLPFPLAIAIAIWRYQLFDISLIIHRTLVYGSLTLILSVLFFGCVALLQGLFQAISGQQSAISIVVSTLAIAALFNPLRTRIQSLIDRRFYRSKYDAQKMLERFAATARSEVELEQLTAELLAVVEETLNPELVSLWLRPEIKI